MVVFYLAPAVEHLEEPFWWLSRPELINPAADSLHVYYRALAPAVNKGVHSLNGFHRSAAGNVDRLGIGLPLDYALLADSCPGLVSGHGEFVSDRQFGGDVAALIVYDKCFRQAWPTVAVV